MVKNADNIASGSCFLLLTRHKNGMCSGGYKVKQGFIPEMALSPTVISLPLRRRINVD